jgi:predicted GH43/DUF377 family glycosyl hydrolase
MRVEFGTIDYENQCINSSFFTKTDGCSNIEKNWVLYTDAKDYMRVVYDWRTTYEIGYANILMNKRDMKSPKFFDLLRGSTNGIRVGKETWFIAHAVSYEDRRYYYHILVCLDTESGEVKRWSKFFTLEGEKVEYVLGFIQTSEDEFMIGYSKMDKECCIKNVSRADLEKLF